MVGSSDILIVSLLAIGATVLIGILGYLIDKKATREEGNGNK